MALQMETFRMPFSIALRSNALKQGLSLNSSSLVWLDWLSSQLQDPPVLSLPRTGVTDMQAMSGSFLWVLRIQNQKLTTPCSHGKHSYPLSYVLSPEI